MRTYPTKIWVPEHGRFYTMRFMSTTRGNIILFYEAQGLVRGKICRCEIQLTDLQRETFRCALM